MLDLEELALEILHSFQSYSFTGITAPLYSLLIKSSISFECNTSTSALISFLSLSPLRTATTFTYGESLPSIAIASFLGFNFASIA